MDQNQLSVSLFNFVTPSGNRVVNNDPWHLQYIDREVNFDPHAYVQVVESSSTHIPQSRIVQEQPGRFIIDALHEVRSPFVFEVDFDHKADTHNSVFKTNTFNPDFSTLQSPDNHLPISLWAKDRNIKTYIRLSDAYKIYPERRVTIPSGSSHRSTIWYNCFHTFCQFDPLNSQLNMIRSKVNLGAGYTYMQFRNEFKLELISIIRRNNGRNIFDLFRMDEGFENSMQSLQRRQAYTTVFRNVRSKISDPGFVQIIRGSKAMGLALWCILPHPNNPGESTEDSEFVLTWLGLLVAENRMLTTNEWEQRKRSAGTSHMNGDVGMNVYNTQLNPSAELTQMFTTLAQRCRQCAQKAQDSLPVSSLTGGIIQSLNEVARFFEAASQGSKFVFTDLRKILQGLSNYKLPLVGQYIDQMDNAIQQYENSQSTESLMNVLHALDVFMQNLLNVLNGASTLSTIASYLQGQSSGKSAGNIP